jgi:hypothetical protein
MLTTIVKSSRDYDFWRPHFAETAGGIGGTCTIANCAVPEPPCALMSLSEVQIMCSSRRAAVSKLIQLLKRVEFDHFRKLFALPKRYRL